MYLIAILIILICILPILAARSHLRAWTALDRIELARRGK